MHARNESIFIHSAAAVRTSSGSLGERLARLVHTWQRRARDRAQLERLDERMLRDIGLDRLAAMSEAAKPFWRA